MAARRPRRPAGSTPPGLFDQPLSEGPETSPAARAASGGAARTPPRQAAEGPLTLSVSDLTREVAARLGGLGSLRVEGELSGIKRAGSGHVYFSLKDREASISCAIWRSRAARAIRFELEEGLQVVAEGKLDVYGPRGTYSLIVERLEPKGIGALLAQLERLKLELKAKGWFERSRPLPPMPRKVGLVTSRDTAALRDILRTRTLRWAGYPLRLCHTPVQGAAAARQIAEAIGRLDASGVDVILVARGGGSLEDLWCFNEFEVAEAIWKASVPVVSGVGHETDVTLADLVADVRAHTPTDAAQRVIPDRGALGVELERQGAFLLQAADDALRRRTERLRSLATRPALCDADRLLGERAGQLGSLLHRAQSAMRNRVGELRAELAHLRAGLERNSPRARIAGWENRLGKAAAGLRLLGPRALQETTEVLARRAAALEAYSPLRVLARGYSLTTRVEDGAPVTSAADLKPGERLETRLAQGRVLSEVVAVTPPSEPSAQTAKPKPTRGGRAS